LRVGDMRGGSLLRRPVVAFAGDLAPLADCLAYGIADLRGEASAHLGHVDRKRAIELGRELDANAQQLVVLVRRAHMTPAAGLQQTVVAVEVEALLLIPTRRPSCVLPCGPRREFILAG